MYRLIVM